MPEREYRLYMPSLRDPKVAEELQKGSKPFVWKALIPEGSVYVGHASVPTLIDMLGFSSAGGPPAVAFLVDPAQKACKVHLFSAIAPGVRFESSSPSVAWMAARGIVTISGALFVLTEHVAVGEGVNVDELFRQAGAIVLESQEYAIPDVLKQQLFGRK